MNSKNRKIIAIVGPTASGKTGIGVKLAKEFNGEIVSADSRQVYRGLDLGTGKEGSPCQELSSVNNQLSVNYQLNNFSINRLNENDKLKIDHLRRNRRCVANIPQWLIDIVNPGEKFSLFDWLPLARLAIEDIFSRGKVPIVVGGTGLYIQALVEGFMLEKNQKSECQMINNKDVISNKASAKRGEVRNLRIDEAEDFSSRRTSGCRNDNSEKEIEELRLRLKKVDPIAFEKIDLNNHQRIIRAIERAEQGLKPTKIRPDFEVLQIGIDLPRVELYKKIDDRVENRFCEGMLEEAIGLIKSGVDIEWLKKLGLEYGIITEFVLENWSFPAYGQMKQQLKYKIHAFARRQLTWFRRFPEITWLKDYKQIQKQVQKFLNKPLIS
ncbi:MAG: tRNA (adenosine(37)-N6)-dimethylallyltransferase MiaA [Patescibacteria group bacterium]